MAERLNLTDLDAHAREETAARVAGDLSAAATSAFHRRYVPPLAVVVLPSRWSILVADDFEIDQDGELELSVDASLEILGSVAGVAGAVKVTSVQATAPLASTGGTDPILSLLDDGVTYAKMQNVSATDKLLGRASGGAGDVEEIACTAFARTIIDDADAAAVRATIGAGTGTGDVIGDDVTTLDQNIAAYNGTDGKHIEELTGTQGDVLYHNGTLWSKLPAGTSGHFLKSQGAGANPIWAAPSVEFIKIGGVYTTTAVYADSAAVNAALGFGTWAGFGSGKTLVGLNSGDTDFDTVEETGGAKTVASAGSNAAEAAHTHSVTTNVTVDDHENHTHTGPISHGTHTHTYTEVPNHVHVENAPSSASGGAVLFALDTNASGSTAAGISTANPTGGVATGTTAASSALTHGNTGTANVALTHFANNPAVTSAAGSSHNHAFTGSATSVVQPYIVVYFWKRTA